MIIFIVGYMGSGKTTVGQLLADDLQIPFVDTDIWIEQQQGISIMKLFASRGEAVFRELERDAIDELCSTYDSAVIAAGGGLPMYYNGMSRLLHQGTVVYLMSSIDDLVSRMINDTSRPLLPQLDISLKQYIRQHLSSRRSTYQQAHIRVWNRGELSAVIDRIRRRIESR